MFGRAWPLRAPVRDGIVPTWPQLMNLQLSPPCTVGSITAIYVSIFTIQHLLTNYQMVLILLDYFMKFMATCTHLITVDSFLPKSK